MEDLRFFLVFLGILVTVLYSLWVLFKIARICWENRSTRNFFSGLFSLLQGFIVGLIPVLVLCLPVYIILSLVLWLNRITGGKTEEDVLREKSDIIQEIVRKMKEENSELEGNCQGR